MEKRLIAILSAGLVGALLVIAFLLGRMSVKPTTTNPEPVTVARDQRPVEVQPAIGDRGEAPSPAVTRPDLPSSLLPTLQPSTTPEARLTAPRDERPSAPFVPADSGSAAAISSYFAKIDAIHVEGSGDPTSFAQGILGGLQRGDSSQIDKLVDDAKLALAQASALQPPSACVEYHRRLIDALSQSVGGLEKFRNAIQKSDLDGITSVMTQLQGAQQKISELESMKKQLLGK